MAKNNTKLWRDLSSDEKNGMAALANKLVKLSRSLDHNLQQAFRETCAAALTEVVMSTPVDRSPTARHPGQARGGWTVGVNSRPTTPTPGTHLDTDGNTTLQEGYVEIRQVNSADQVVYIVNDVDYIALLNAGYSGQAPAGFVDKALMKARATFRLRSFLSDAQGGEGGRF